MATINGTAGNDTLNGTSTADTIFGQGGDDVITGAGATDLLDGQQGSDIYMINSSTEHVAAEFRDTGVDGIDEVRFAMTASAQTFTLFAGDIGIERIVIGTGTGVSAVTSGVLAHNVDARALANGVAIIGNSGNNILQATGFADELSGGNGNDGLYGFAGDDRLDGGLGNDLIDGGTGSDTANFISSSLGVTVSLAITGAQNSGQGMDTLTAIENLAGSAFADTLTGDALANVLDGAAGNDILVGGAGNDLMVGGDGNDSLDGGEGSDVYVVGSASEHGVAEIADSGLSGTDELRFTRTDTAQTLVLSAGDSGIERIVIGTGTGATAITTGVFHHNVDASALQDGVQIFGNYGDNIIHGGSGNDYLDGGLGYDQLYGGAGDDTYEIYGSGVAHENAGEGIDTLISWSGGNLSDIYVNIENLLLSGSADMDGTGNDGANILGGNEGRNRLHGLGGDDLIYGNGGNDDIYGDGGNDSLHGGAGDDSYWFVDAGDVVVELAGEGADTIYTTASFVLPDNVETLILSNYDLSGTGNGLANKIIGNVGHDILSGMAGDDELLGIDGNDILNGGSGNDTLDGGAGRDTASYAGSSTGVTVSLAIAGSQNVAGVESDTLTNIEDLTGSGHGDTLTGNSSANSLQGGGGDDVLTGGAGADTLTGGSGYDSFRDSKAGLNGDTLSDFALGDKIIITDATLAGFTFSLSGNTLTYSGGSLTLQGPIAGNLVAAAAAGGGVELSLQAAPTEGDDALTGTEQDDDINGLGGNDSINGLGGTDVLHGGGGNDTLSGDADNDGLYGDSGDDTLNGGAGDDSLAGGAGNDVIDGGDNGEFGDFLFYLFSGSITVNLGIAGPQFISWSEGTDTLVNVENVTGSDQDDQITGNAGANRLFGEWGWDILNGAGGTDYLDAGDGLDTYIIASAADHAAAEIADSGAGAFDIHDMVYFTTAAAETLKLFAGDTGLEYLLISNSSGETSGTVAAGIDASLVLNSLTITGNDGANILKGTGFFDSINGKAGADRLYGNDGGDWLNGGDGDDYLYGHAGDDTLVGGAGYDRMYGGAGNDSYQVNDSTDYAYENVGEGIDRVISSINSHTLRANVEELELVEAAVTGKGNDLDNLILGNELNNRLYGLAGSDTLEGRGGSDTLDGGAGADVLIGEYGNDQYYVDDAGDQTIEEADAGIDTARTTIDITLAANVENVVLLGSANLNATGNELNNVMNGNAGDNQFIGGAGVDQLKGLDGDDLLDGGAGSDRLYGGTGHDQYVVDTTGDLIFENVGEGWDSVNSSVTYVLAANLEGLNLTGHANINGTGNDIANSITGNDGANILSGNGGNDTLDGEAGADVLKGGAGDDWLEGGSGRDRFYGDEGGDKFLFMTPDFAGLTSSTCDQIHDFSQAEGDRIDLGLVDGNVNVDGLDDLVFIGSGAFTGAAGELRYYQSNGQTYVEGDTDGDGSGDFLIRLDGLHNLQASDFLI